MNITGNNLGSYVALVVAPDAGAKVKASDVQIVAQSAADQTKWLEDDKLSKSTGGTVAGKLITTGTGADAADIAAASVDVLVVDVSATYGPGALLLLNNTSIISMQGRIRHKNRVGLTDADHTVDTTATQYVLTAPTADRVITLNSTSSPTPVSEEEIEFFLPDMNGATDATTITIQREDATEVAHFLMKSATKTSAFCRVRFVGVAWTISSNSGHVVSAGVSYGVFPP